MHRTEGGNNLSNTFRSGEPGTAVGAAWLNSIQEEICYVIEQVGLVVETESSDSRTQLFSAIQGASVFPAGTKMLFYSDEAPEGWTLDATVDDKLAYTTKGSIAGGWTGGFAIPFGNGEWEICGLDEIGHTHTITSTINDVGDAGAGGYRLDANPDTTDVGSSARILGGDGTWRPACYCFILCSKD